MGVTRLDCTSARDFYAARIAKLRPDSQRQWGSLEVTPMLAHLTQSTAMSLGEIPVEDKSNLFNRTIVKHVFLKLLPWPKGKIKAPPEMFPEHVADFETERARLLAVLDRFVAAVRVDPGKKYISPFLGPQPLAFWAFVHGKHLQHHLGQFGV